MDSVMFSRAKLLAKPFAAGPAQESLHKTSLNTCDSSGQHWGLGAQFCNTDLASSTNC